jgi:tetratricopeptide (TPR) repeat protein
MTRVMLLIILCSCSAVNHKRMIAGNAIDLLTDESFSRFSLERLEGFKSNNELNRFVLHCFKGETSKGLELLQGKLSEHRTKSTYWNNIGTCYKNANNLEKSMFFYNLALTKVKTKLEEAQITNNIAIVLFKMNHHQKSFEFFNIAANLQPNAKTPLFNIALIMIKYGHNNKAIKLLSKLNQHNPKDPSIRSALAQVLVFTNKLSQAIKIYQTLTVQEQKKPMNAFYFSYALHNLGQAKRALIVFNERDRSGEFKFKLVAKKIKKILEGRG